jgi:hypothetical protein
MSTPRQYTVWFVMALLLSLVVATAAVGEQCDGEAGTCPSSATSSSCVSTTTDKLSVYRFGGTAQAYKEDAPFQSTICDPADYVSSSSYKVASWPYSRRSYASAPRVKLVVTPLACSGASDASPITIQAWQTRPDGRYSSLRPGVDEGDCRAQAQSSPGAAPLVFDTVAPGSYGSLGGLGPGGWDFMPYGPAVVHLWAMADGYAPTLVDLPVAMDARSLQAKSPAFGWTDWRGASWMRSSAATAEGARGYEITAWTADLAARQVTIEVTLFLQPAAPTTASAATVDSFCEAPVYGLPASFFREPLAVCARPLLDFFAL